MPNDKPRAREQTQSEKPPARGETIERIEWERSKLYCPNCGIQGLWTMVDRKGTYPCVCQHCSESCEIDPWRAYELPR